MAIAIQNSILLHGTFTDDFFDTLKKSGVKKVFVTEGRPTLEHSQRTCKALLKHKIKPVVIADNMAGFLFYQKQIPKVMAGYHMKDATGAMLAIGGLVLAILAKKHKVPFEIYPGTEDFDFLGKQEDLTSFNGQKVISKKIKAFVPLVGWVPKKYITKVVT